MKSETDISVDASMALDALAAMTLVISARVDHENAAALSTADVRGMLDAINEAVEAVKRILSASDQNEYVEWSR